MQLNFTKQNPRELGKQERLEFLRKIRTFRKTLKHTLATTRFNNFTWDENCKMRRTNPVAKCIYACPIQISVRVTLDSNVFVLEMNNEQNQIMGIGLVKNHPVVGKYAVHSVHNYNRFIYIGKWRIDREDMSESELEYLKLLESVCFRGTNHCKRGQGITALPMIIQYTAHTQGLELIDIVCNMFKTRMEQTNK